MELSCLDPRACIRWQHIDATWAGTASCSRTVKTKQKLDERLLDGSVGMVSRAVITPGLDKTSTVMLFSMP